MFTTTEEELSGMTQIGMPLKQLILCSTRGTSEFTAIAFIQPVEMASPFKSSFMGPSNPSQKMVLGPMKYKQHGV